MDDLDLENCKNIFQVRGSKKDEYGYVDDVLNQFVQMISFDISADYVDGEIPIQSAGAFTGYLNSIYVSQEFAAAISVINDSTHILGFDIGGEEPVPFSYGVVEGSPLNQYSVDLYDGNLRLATTKWDWGAADDFTTNRISVLRLPTGLGSNVKRKPRHRSKRSGHWRNRPSREEERRHLCSKIH
jgi:hypothetical protein